MLLLPAATGLHAAPDAPAAPASAAKPAPVVRNIKSLADCPAPVQAGVKRDGHEQQVTEITRIETDGKVLWAFETGTEEDGRDQEINYFYLEDGTLQRTEADIPFKDAPEAVQQKLLELAGKTSVVDDVEKVEEQGRTSYKAELESNGDTDRKVTLAADGTVLTLAEETDD